MTDRARTSSEDLVPRGIKLLFLDGMSLAWLTGIFEGEGSVYAKKDPRGDWTNFQLSVEMTDEDIIDRLEEITGVGNTSSRDRLDPNAKHIYRWLVSNRDDVIALCQKMYPLLGERRRGQVDRVFEAHEAQGPRKKLRRTNAGCAVAECDRKHYGRGWCHTHWRRNYKYGRLTTEDGGK